MSKLTQDPAGISTAHFTVNSPVYLFILFDSHIFSFMYTFTHCDSSAGSLGFLEELIAMLFEYILGQQYFGSLFIPNLTSVTRGKQCTLIRLRKEGSGTEPILQLDFFVLHRILNCLYFQRSIISLKPFLLQTYIMIVSPFPMLTLPTSLKLLIVSVT